MSKQVPGDKARGVTSANAMARLAHGQTHGCAPKPWRDVPNVTGDYDLDATILRRHNTDLPHRLDLYTKTGPGYGPLTGYSAYHNYHGDT
jgi:hypothetical protein